MKLIECVPNFSEGRDRVFIDSLKNIVNNHENVFLLDIDPGADTNRTVLTFAGKPDDVINNLGNKYIDKWNAQMNCKTNDAGCFIGPTLLDDVLDKYSFTPLGGLSVLPDIRGQLEVLPGEVIGEPTEIDPFRVSEQDRQKSIKEALALSGIEDCSTRECTHRERAEWN